MMATYVNHSKKSVWRTSIAALFAMTALLLAADHGASGREADPANNPLTVFTTEFFAGSGVCTFCHSELKDAGGNDVSIDAHWRSTMMANASNDPLWRAKVVSETVRNPALAEVIEDRCATCHMPMAHNQASADGAPTLIFDGGFLDNANAYSKAAKDGVSCTLCHQIEAANLGKEQSFSGHYSIDDTTQKPNRVINGPFTNPVMQQQMINFSGYTPVYGSHTLNSELCATCHTLFTPFVDENGEVAGKFPEQTPYLEWEQSDVSKTKQCQDCHMPEADGGVVLSNIFAGGMRNQPARSPFARHHFVGGNAFMMAILAANVATLDLTATKDLFDATAQRAIKQLQNSTAALSITGAKVDGGTLEFNVVVENKTGHKFPTGFPSRRAWLQVTVKDASGKTVFASGNYKKKGNIANGDADSNKTAYEPHYTVITSEDQVQIYETIMVDVGKDVTYTLLEASAYVKDNRLLPAGFNKKKVGADIAVYGKAKRDRNFAGGGDTVTYRIDAGGKAPYSIKVSLFYQTVSYRFYLDLLSDRTAESKAFKKMYRKAGNRPVVMLTASAEAS